MLQLNFNPFPYLTTDRLSLAMLEPEDDNEIMELRSNENVNKFLDRNNSISLEDARLFIKKIEHIVFKNEGIYWKITLKNTTKLIGTICCYNILAENNQAEIGYELFPMFQGKGIMQEAISAVIDYCFNEIGIKTILAFPSAFNVASIKLLERNGFKINNSIKAEPTQMLSDLVAYSLVKK